MKKKEIKKGKTVSSPAKSNLYIRLSIVLVALFLYGRTAQYEFTLDDKVLFVENKTVAKGIKAIPEIFSENSFIGFFGSANADDIYRPVTLTTFAVQKDLLGTSPRVSHIINILLYILVGLILFSFLKLFFDNWPVWICGAISLLFIAHPIHTEVVCSVKSRDELLGCVFGLLALRSLLKEHMHSFSWKQFVGPCWMMLAVFSKESTLSIVFVIPFVLYFKGENSFRKIALATVPYIAVAFLFLVVRHSVLTGQTFAAKSLVMNNILNAASGFSQLYGTRFYLLLLFLKMVAFPYPLCWDYSFKHVPVSEISDFYPILSILIHLALAGLMIYYFKKRDPISFGILFFLVTSSVTNNFFIKIGATFAERFLFIPSIGFLIFVTGAVYHLFKSDPARIVMNKYARIVFAGLFIIYCSVSYGRIPDWQNDFELFRSGAATAPNSVRALNALGSQYINKVREMSEDSPDRITYINEAKANFTRSLEIYPENFEGYYALGLIAMAEGDVTRSKRKLKECIHYAPEYRNAYHDLAVIYSNTNEYDSALFYLDKIKPDAVDYQAEYTVYSFIYLQKKEYKKAISYAEKGIKAAPKDPGNYKNMAAALYNLGDTSNAIFYFNRYQELGGK